MGRSANFAYSASPVEEIGSSLARALFGDPEAAAKQRHQVAQAEALAAQTRQADAHAGLYDSQTAGQNYQNSSAVSLPGLIEFGTVKTNMPADVAWLKEGEGVLCRRDPDTFTLLPIAPNEDANAKASGDDIERIADAIRKLNEAGRVVHRTGATGIYEQRLPALAGLSRSFIQQAVNSLIEIGRVQATKDGLFVVDPDGANDEPTS